MTNKGELKGGVGNEVTVYKYSCIHVYIYLVRDTSKPFPLTEAAVLPQHPLPARHLAKGYQEDPILGWDGLDQASLNPCTSSGFVGVPLNGRFSKGPELTHSPLPNCAQGVSRAPHTP